MQENQPPGNAVILFSVKLLYSESHRTYTTDLAVILFELMRLKELCANSIPTPVLISFPEMILKFDL